MIFNLALILVPIVPLYDTIMITTVTASKVRKAMTPTTVPTNTGIGTAAALRPVSVLVETDVDLSASVTFTEVALIVETIISEVSMVSNCKVVVGSKELKAGVCDTAKHNTRMKLLLLLIGMNVNSSCKR